MEEPAGPTWLRHAGPVVEAAIGALARERAAGGALLAGGLAYRFFLWIVPLGLVLGSLASIWADADRVGFEGAARDLGLSAVTARTAGDALAEGAHSRWYLLAVGAVLLAWFAVGAARALRAVHALAWGQAPTRMRRPVAAAGAFTAGALALLALSAVAASLREHLGALGLVLTLLLVPVYAAVALLIMRALPHGDAPPAALVPGAALVAVGIQAVHLFTVVYLAPRLGRSSETLGTLGAATTLLLGLYVLARLLTLAAFLNASLWERRG